MRIITDASLNDIKQELGRMLNDGTRCPEVRAMAIQVMDENDRIASVFNWAKDNFTYVPDPNGRELFISPRKLLEQFNNTHVIAGDCDDAALFITSLLGSIGYETKISLVDSDYDFQYDHAIGSVNTKEGWLDLDLVSSKPLGWIYKYNIREDINA